MNQYKELFHLPDDLIYLNCAYMSPLLKSVEEAGIEAIKKRRNPLHITPEFFFTDTEDIRMQFGSMINAEPSRIVLVPSVSYGMANVARNLRLEPGQKILVAGAQFPSNYYPWKRIADEKGCSVQVIEPDNSRKEGRGRDWNDRILENIDDSTAMIALAHVHWADGTLFNLDAIRKKTREKEALMIIDGTQSVGAYPFDVEELQPDALVCAGYKWLMGPYALGLAYYGKAFDGGSPVEENWINRLHSENFSGLVNYEDNYQPGALRYEVGEHSNFNLVPMLKRALEQVTAFTPGRIQDHCREISQEAFERLRSAGCLIADDSERSGHLVGIRLPPEADMETVKASLSARKINVSFRGNAIRVAPHLYNDAAEMLQFARQVEESIAQKERL